MSDVTTNEYAPDSEGVRRIRGTGGGLDYIVVAKKGPIVLGVKTLVTTIPDKEHNVARLYLGFRIRSAPDPLENPTVTGDTLTAAWPDIKFTRVDDTRASCVIGMALSKTAGELEHLMDAVHQVRLFSKLATFLSQFISEEETILDFDVFRNTIETQIKEQVANSPMGQMTKAQKLAKYGSQDAGFQQKINLATEALQEAQKTATDAYTTAIDEAVAAFEANNPEQVSTPSHENPANQIDYIEAGLKHLHQVEEEFEAMPGSEEVGDETTTEENVAANEPFTNPTGGPKKLMH